MFISLIRKARQVVHDPVLRRWLFSRLAGGVSGPGPFAAHRPPYLDGTGASKSRATDPPPPAAFRPLASPPPTGPIELPLPGLSLRLAPGDAGEIFRRSYDDMETLLALHRFAWVPLVEGSGITASWVQALWEVWRKTHGVPGKGWAWHPYTVTERAINLLDLAEKKGLPEPVEETVALLEAHAEVIFENLEYFGELNTSNHLANNGRGLYRLGLALGLEWAAEAGARILEEEAERIFLQSGVLREGSSHYHLLIARNYADAWLAARAHGRAEEERLGDITARALAVIPWLVLPGGLPLVGDISPDCPPEYLMGLVGAEIGWMAGLPKDSRNALLALIDATPAASAEGLCTDGWLRFGHGPWTGLWHAAPEGWSQMPGHGHQDCGSFEVHFADQPLFIDPGRGAYGEDGDDVLFRSGAVHNAITVDGHDPYPPNKPFYEEAFRRRIGGSPPVLLHQSSGVSLSFDGFRRLAGGGLVNREWRFSDAGFEIADRAELRGRHRVTRRLITPLAAEADGDGIRLSGSGHSFHITSDAGLTCAPSRRWVAYGQSRQAWEIWADAETDGPWAGNTTVRIL